jgi:diacylglycerol kinase family enzyme
MSRYLQALPNFAVREIDVWRINGRRFVNSAGFGLDAQVLATMASFRGLLAHNYVLAFIATLPRLRTFHIRAEGDGGTLVAGNVWWLVAMNSPFIGGGIPIAPNAQLDDGKLDIVAIHACSRWELALKLPKVLAGRHIKDSRVSFHQTGYLKAESQDQPVAVEGDGELLPGSRRFELAHAGRLKVLCATVDTR